MKKLLCLLSIALCGASAPLTLYYATNTYKKSNSSDESLASASVGATKALLENKIHNLNSNQVLQYEENADPSAATGLNNIFSQHEDISNMMSQESTVKYSPNGQSYIPSTVQDITKLLNTVNDSKNFSPTYIADMAYLSNLPKIIGSELSNIIGSENPIVKILLNIPVNFNKDVINNFNSYYSGKSYVTYNDNKNTEPLTFDDTSAFGVAYSKVSPLVPYILNGDLDKLTKQNTNDISTFILLIISYISHFTVSTNEGTFQPSDDMYYTDQTNQVYRTNLDADKVETFDQAIKPEYLEKLISNISEYDTDKNGLGISQLLDILFGSENAIAVSKNYNTSDLTNGIIVPDARYYNPLITFFEDTMNDNWNSMQPILSKITKLNSYTLNILKKYNLFTQMIALLGGLVDNVATNSTVDNEMNIIWSLLYDVKIGFQTLPIPSTIVNSINELISFLENNVTIDNNIMNSKDGYSPESNFNANGYNYTLPSDVTVTGNTWNYFWNGNISWYSEFSKTISSITSKFGIQLELPSQFNGMRAMLDSFLQKKVPGIGLTYVQLLQELDEKNGIIETILFNYNKIFSLMTDLNSGINNTQLLSEAKDWIKTNVNVSSDKQLTNLFNNLNNNGTLLDALSIISIASSKNELASEVTSNQADQEYFSLIGYDVNTGKASTSVTGMTIFEALTTNKDLLAQLLSVITNTFNDINSILVNNTIVQYLSKWSSPSDIETDGKTGNITYKISNSLNDTTYDVTLVKDNNDDFYKLSVA